MRRYQCPLCRGRASGLFYQDARRAYLQCPACHLVFVPPDYYLTQAAEKIEYDLHENDPADEGYRRFLSRLFEPVNRLLPPGSSGLDFGCGSGPLLADMFKSAGHNMALYDPHYAPDAAVLADVYGFITASEVLEHLHRPGEDLDKLVSILKPGGILGLMTGMVRDRTAFSSWHYIRDLTHVCFFSRATFNWLAARWALQIVFSDDRVVLLKKSVQAS